ncbi:hypothetical protein [Sphingomonas colocasiae]|uniref:Uncharacterized protein n=1 Tax=Sphingomonas colocasiae TaxID=1848973 RepID=A0ABS7Q2G3_9SPHN|nr:hypothetical protein [Sphingomonas colocasiae]MBY8823304.1 hypothetical protein [Sphingomonas colocasiae]MBY8826439.1 hypothetical protein [Sphingomonas colocasiae]
MTTGNSHLASADPCEALSPDTRYDMLLALNRHFRKDHGFEILTPDAKLFCVVGAKKTLSVKEAMLYSGLSYRGFYLVAARLGSRGVIVFEADPRDARVKRISLGPRAGMLDPWILPVSGRAAVAGASGDWSRGAAA